MARTTPLPLDEHLCFALSTASRALSNRYRTVLARFGLTYPQYLVVLALLEHGPQSVSRLGERLRLDSGTLSPLLKRLAEAGLVTRTRSTADERTVLIELTADGSVLRVPLAAVPAEVYRGVRLTVAEMGALRDQLADLTADLTG